MIVSSFCLVSLSRFRTQKKNKNLRRLCGKIPPRTCHSSANILKQAAGCEVDVLAAAAARQHLLAGCCTLKMTEEWGRLDSISPHWPSCDLRRCVRAALLLCARAFVYCCELNVLCTPRQEFPRPKSGNHWQESNVRGA
jgi:hypothetical protein